jgi:hypothetical protein
MCSVDSNRTRSTRMQGMRHADEEIQRKDALRKTVQRIEEKLTLGRKKKHFIT